MRISLAAIEVCGGAPGADRTRNLQLRRLSLYPIELQAHDGHRIRNMIVRPGPAVNDSAVTALEVLHERYKGVNALYRECVVY